MRPSRWWCAAACALLAVLTSACSTGSDPNASPTTAGSTGPTTGPTAGPTAGPVLPSTTSTAPTASTTPPFAQRTPGVVSTGQDGVQQVLISGFDRFFQPGVVHVHPGKVRVILRNDDPVEPHNLIFPDNGGARTKDTLPGQADSVTVLLNKPGLYDFICSFHELVGMRGQVKVE